VVVVAAEAVRVAVVVPAAPGLPAGLRRSVVVVVAGLAGGVAVPAGLGRMLVDGAVAVAVTASC
jgi:hypothetical protein